MKLQKFMIGMMFPTTVTEVAEKTGIPIRTVRLYCAELNLRKAGKTFLIFETDMVKILDRDQENIPYQKSQRN